MEYHNQNSILILEDDLRIRKMLQITLSAKGYTIYEASTKREGIEFIALYSPKLILLDLQLPDGGGEDLIHEIRIWTQTPVIIISVMNQEEDKIRLLDAGADDYITKPFAMGEVLARIRTAFRRIPEQETPPLWKCKDLEIDLKNYSVQKNGKEIRLTPTEFQLLALFVQNSGKVLTYETIIPKIWGENAMNEMNSLRVHITQLRRKIETELSNPEFLITEPGIGYRFMK